MTYRYFFPKASAINDGLPARMALLGVLLAGFGLRLRFALTVYPYPDEFVTQLAVRAILEKGLPVLPSGLFYEHGLLFSYAGALFTLITRTSGSPAFGIARLGVRAAGLFASVLTIALVYGVGRRAFGSRGVGLFAAALLAFAPDAVAWGGRARMYSLLQLLVLLALYLAYRGYVEPGGGRARWGAIAAYAGALLTQFAAVALAPPLLVAALYGEKGKRRRGAWLELAALGGVVLAAFVVKRAGQPKGLAPMDSAAGVGGGVLQVLSIYAALPSDLAGAWASIAPFYVSTHALLPTLLAAAGVLAALYAHFRHGRGESATLFSAFLLGLTTLEMITLVSPDRRDDKYLFMLMPVLFLLAGEGARRLGAWFLGRRVGSAATAALCVFSLIAAWPSVEKKLEDRGHDYDTAFAHVREHIREDEKILTGTPAAAGLYLGRNDYYAMQSDIYDYRILQTGSGAKVDRWMASPWIGTEEELHDVLAANPGMWIVLERWGLIGQYYTPIFTQQMLAQTDFVREDTGIIVLRPGADPRPIAPEPANPAAARLGGKIELTGYTLEPGHPAAGTSPRLTLYWHVLDTMPVDYSVFVHLRDSSGGNAAQADHAPLGSVYPTTLWQPGETIRETGCISLPDGLAPGEYSLLVGVYDLATMERLPVENDTTGENAVPLGPVTVTQK